MSSYSNNQDKPIDIKKVKVNYDDLKKYLIKEY